MRDDEWVACIARAAATGAANAATPACERRKQRSRRRAADIERELEKLRPLETRQRVSRAAAPPVALVGYTNAGKSSLLRGLTGNAVEVGDELFVTLGTTVRALAPAVARAILVSDTVGFIQNLPHEVIGGFHATLDEARDASLLLYVVDAADARWRGRSPSSRRPSQAVGD